MAITTRRIFLLLILWLAFGLRFYRLEAQSFWNDEGNSARLSERSLALIIEGTASDVHPPLYYVLLRGWRELVGKGEFGLRSLSALAGVLVVAVTMGIGRQLSIVNCQLLIVNCRNGYWLVGLVGVLTAVVLWFWRRSELTLWSFLFQRPYTTFLVAMILFFLLTTIGYGLFFIGFPQPSELNW